MLTGFRLWGFSYDEFFYFGENACEADIHAFDCVRKFDVSGSLFGKLLDIVARSWVVTQVQNSSKSVQTVSDSDV